MQKTIFITISRSFITRNILRSGTLDLLKKSGHKIIVFFQSERIPDYLKKEFEDEQVKLFAVQTGAMNPLLRRLLVLKDYLIFTDSTKVRLFYAGAKHVKSGEIVLLKNSRTRVCTRLFLAKLISSISFLKPLSRWIDFHLFPEKNNKVQKYFDIYRPNLVFSTSIISTLDNVFLKEAKRRKIKTLSMPKSWDNITNGYYRFVPDYFLVPNPFSSRVAHTLQDIPKERIYVVGIPAFDWYCKEEIKRGKKEHFKIKGLDPNRTLLFFGSEGAWAVNDKKIAENIYEWVKNDELARPCQLLVRPHFSNVKDNVFEKLRGKAKVVVDDYRTIDFLADKWEPSISETIDFTNSVLHCDIMINAASTLSLDAVYADKPVINIGFGCEFSADGKDITNQLLYGSDHMKSVLSTGGTEKADSLEELKKQINRYLLNPKIRAEGRSLLREKLCFKVDGLSSRRIADTIDDILSNY